MVDTKDWDSWKKYENSTERMIYLDQAQRDQIEIMPWPTDSKLMKDVVQVMVRGKLVGTMPKKWKASLRLGDHNPMVSVTTPSGEHATFTVNLKPVAPHSSAFVIDWGGRWYVLMRPMDYAEVVHPMEFNTELAQMGVYLLVDQEAWDIMNQTMPGDAVVDE